MKLRLVASIAIGAALTLGAAGCSLVAPQATTIEYSASDGVNVPDSGPIEVRNAMVIADEEGTTGNFIAAFVNPTAQRQTIVFGFGSAAADLVIEAGDSLSLGVDGNEPIRLEGIDTPPGAQLSMSFQSGDGEGVTLDVPVLDGSLPPYEDLVPTAE